MGRFIYSTLFLIVSLVSPVFFNLSCGKYIHLGLVPEIDATDIAPTAKNYPKVPADQIMVYPSRRFAPKGYLLIASLKSASTSYSRTEEDLMGEFRKRASELGADAVIVLEITHPAGASQVEIRTGLQPSNDLAYATHSQPVRVAEVFDKPQDVPVRKTDIKGYALAIRSKP